MNLLSAENISITVGDKTLFSNINFGLQQGNKVGLIGINGTGKSTFLQILAGVLKPDSGNVSVRKETIIGYLSQNPILVDKDSVFNNVFNNRNPLTLLVKQYEHLIHHPLNTDSYHRELENVTNEMHLKDAWNFEYQVREIIGRLGIGNYMDDNVGRLSGGQRKRVALARTLAEEPDVLILDEPTNHLDIDTVEWLQHLIKSQFQTILMVTHDRYFLDGVTDSIIELENGELAKYPGNYGWYLEKKALKEEVAMSETEKARNLYRKELEWIRRMPKARGTKSKSRVEAFGEIKEKIAGVKTEASVLLDVKNIRQGGKILEIRDIGKAFGNNVLIKHFRHHFKPGEKAGILGPNGSGKTTLLKILTGGLAPDKGDIVLGENTVIGYYDQEEELKPADLEKRLIDVVSEVADQLELADGTSISASQFLNRFKFPPATQYKTVNKLSGGERKRLQLLKILIKNPNFLILDEPTNDLDIGTLNVLEEFLLNFKGSVLLVSHDRYFMDKLVDHVFVFEGNGEIRDFPGNYTDYRLDLDSRKATVKELKNPARKPTEHVENTLAKTKRSFKEIRELELLEAKTEELEARKLEIHAALNGAVSDHEKIIELSNELKRVDEELDVNLARWVELSE